MSKRGRPITHYFGWIDNTGLHLLAMEKPGEVLWHLKSTDLYPWSIVVAQRLLEDVFPNRGAGALEEPLRLLAYRLTLLSVTSFLEEANGYPPLDPVRPWHTTSQSVTAWHHARKYPVEFASALVLPKVDVGDEAVDLHRWWGVGRYRSESISVWRLLFWRLSSKGLTTLERDGERRDVELAKIVTNHQEKLPQTLVSLGVTTIRSVVAAIEHRPKGPHPLPKVHRERAQNMIEQERSSAVALPYAEIEWVCYETVPDDVLNQPGVQKMMNRFLQRYRESHVPLRHFGDKVKKFGDFELHQLRVDDIRILYSLEKGRDGRPILLVVGAFAKKSAIIPERIRHTALRNLENWRTSQRGSVQTVVVQ